MFIVRFTPHIFMDKKIDPIVFVCPDMEVAKSEIQRRLDFDLVFEPAGIPVEHTDDEGEKFLSLTYDTTGLHWRATGPRLGQVTIHPIEVVE